MAQPIVHHIEVDEGTGYSHTFTITDPTTGIVQDLTGYTARMDVKSPGYNAHSSMIMPITYSSASSTITRGVTLGDTAGTVTIVIPASDTLVGGWYGGTTGNYDLMIINPAGAPFKYVKGFFTIRPSITKLA